MPTGYTRFIEDGDIKTGRDFIKLCARNSVELIHMRDMCLSKDIPTEVLPDIEYDNEQLAECQLRLTEIEKMTDEEIITAIDKNIEDRIKDYKDYIKKYTNIKNAYLKILSEVKAWVPPTSNHEGLKRFAIEQISICLPSVDTEYYQKALEEIKAQPKQTASEYRAREKQHYLEEIEYYRNHIKEEVERANSRNQWLQELLSSL